MRGRQLQIKGVAAYRPSLGRHMAMLHAAAVALVLLLRHLEEDEEAAVLVALSGALGKHVVAVLAPALVVWIDVDTVGVEAALAVRVAGLGAHLVVSSHWVVGAAPDAAVPGVSPDPARCVVPWVGVPCGVAVDASTVPTALPVV